MPTPCARKYIPSGLVLRSLDVCDCQKVWYRSPKWIQNIQWKKNGRYNICEHIRKSSSAKPGVKDDIPCQDVYFGHRVAAKVHFHRTVTLANLPEKCMTVQDRTVCFVKKFSHHPIWQGFEELHVASDFVPTMFSFHVTFDLHGMDR